jgi:hypothetical protein
MQCTIGEEVQYMCDGKEGIGLKTYPIGVDIVEVARVPCHVSESNISREDSKVFF